MTMDVLGKGWQSFPRLSHAVRARQVAIYNLAMTSTRRQSVLGCALRRERDKRRRVAPSDMPELLSNSCQKYSGERFGSSRLG
jgi:hypothetical protein